MHRGNLVRRHEAWGYDMIMQNFSLVRSSEAKALHYLEVSSIRRDNLLRVIASFARADQLIIRRCAARLAMCRYVVERSRMVVDGKPDTNGSLRSLTDHSGLFPGKLVAYSRNSTEKELVSGGSKSATRDGELTDDKPGHALEAKLEDLQNSQRRMEAMLIELSREMREQRRGEIPSNLDA